MKLTPQEQTELAAALKKMSISAISSVIRSDWINVWFGAVPYLDAMASMTSIKDNVGMDDGKSVVNYFIGNAKLWRGDVARLVKAELRHRINH